MKFTQSMRRKLIQLAAVFLTNREVGNLLTGKLYKGGDKVICAPGLNCYSCPAATMSCPIGALQTVGGTAGYSFGFYAAGFMMLIGVLLGRAVCGFLCPFGLLQELLHRVPVRKRRFFPPLRYLKYVMLLVFVLLLPEFWIDYADVGAPAFCQYICPAGTLEGGLPLLAAHPAYRQVAGMLFVWKCLVLAVVLFGSMAIYRFFCRTLCPLGLIYGWLNRVSLYRMKTAPNLCVGCGACKRACPMELDPLHQQDSIECIRCGACASACEKGAIR